MRNTRIAAAVIAGAALLLGLTAATNFSFAAGKMVINEKDRLVLHGNVRPEARPQFYKGQALPFSPENRMVLLLKLTPEKQAALDRFTAEQLDKSSPNYHRWLTPEEYGKRFGRSPKTIGAVNQWLVSHGFTVLKVSKARNRIDFSGTVGQVETAFHTQINNYLVKGHLYHANATDPSIPRAFEGIVAGPVSLNNFPVKGMHTAPIPIVNGKPALNGKSTPQYWDPNYDWYELSPFDFNKIYDVPSSYTGAGVTIAVVGETTSAYWPGDWNSFRSYFSLPVNTPQIICNGTCPANNSEDENESDLDVEWAGAVAPGATIDYVTSQSTNSNPGVDFSAQYIVDNRLAPIISDSYGNSEEIMSKTRSEFYNTLWEQAAAEGITVLVSSGDNGAYMNMTTEPSVLGTASTPYDVAVGGTEFAGQNSTNFNSYWDSKGYAMSYIPETSWNDGYIGATLWASGGGASALYAKPAWQVCPGVPNDGKRDLPDVSLDASRNVGYEVVDEGALYDIGGTSASAPSFAGIVALIEQKVGQWQGNIDPVLYQLGNAQYSGAKGAATVFHDINDGSGNGYYAAGTGYDQVTGLGSVDAVKLLQAFTPAAPVITSLSPTSGPVGTQVTITGTGFSGATAVSVNGVSATFTVSSYSQIVCTAPTGAATGPVTVTTSGGTSNGVTFTVTQQSGGLWQNAVATGGGWYYLSPFGAFNTNASPWIYHQTMGWLYPVGTSTGSIWFYDPQWDGTGGWWWTSSSFFPWVYSTSEGNWLYFDAKDSTPAARWFFSAGGQASTH